MMKKILASNTVALLQICIRFSYPILMGDVILKVYVLLAYVPSFEVRKQHWGLVVLNMPILLNSKISCHRLSNSQRLDKPHGITPHPRNPWQGHERPTVHHRARLQGAEELQPGAGEDRDGDQARRELEPTVPRH